MEVNTSEYSASVVTISQRKRHFSTLVPHKSGKQERLAPSGEPTNASTPNMSATRRQLTRASAGLLVFILLCHGIVTPVEAAGEASSGDVHTPGTLRPDCRNTLGWVPFILKKPFTSLLNSAYCPSWMSRNLVTKKEQYSHLYLPEGVPFSFFCGVCYPKTSHVDINVTVTQTGYYGDAIQIQQRPVNTADGDPVHQNRGQKCRIVYAITGPLRESGNLQCTLNYATRECLEPVTFSIQSGTTTKTEETMEVSSQTVKLSCPRHPKPEAAGSPITHVWFYPSPSNLAIAAPTNNPHVTFRLTNEPLVVACATYHLLGSSNQAMITTYTVKRAQSSFSRQNPPKRVATIDSAANDAPHYIESGDTDNDQRNMALSNSAGVTGPSIMVIVGSTTAAILGVIFVIGGLKYCHRRVVNKWEQQHNQEQVIYPGM